MEERIKILDWLSPHTYKALYTEALGKRQTGTGIWFLKSPQFENWVRGNLSTLYCFGIPGAGKTVLTSIAIEYLKSLECSGKLRVAYFFCNYQRQEEQKTEDILAAILRQLLEQYDQIPASVYDLYHKSSRPSSDELFEILSIIIGSQDRVYLIVDALDECSGEVRKVLEKIRDLQDISKTSFMATSRSIDAVNKEFPSDSWFEIHARAADVEMYLEDQLKYLPECINNNHDIQRDVKKCIIDGIHGM